MTDDRTDPRPASATAQIALTIAGKPLAFEVTVSTGPVPATALLPFAHGLADAAVSAAEDRERAAGRAISCRAGCGACCRQLVPVAPVEARRIVEICDSLPEPRRSEVRARFDAVRARLAEAGLLDPLMHAASIPDAQRREIGLAYFRLRLPCPFLESESCSIHPQRPASCREYLVTSPAANCAQPAADTVQCVEMPVRVSNALLDPRESEPSGREVWVPLALAPSWVESHPDAPSPRPGPDVLREFLGRLAPKT